MKRLTARLKMQVGESLSSYILRIAAENGMSFVALLNHIRKGKYRLHCGYLNRLDEYPQYLIDIEKFSTLTNFSSDTVLSGTMTNVFRVFRGTSMEKDCKFLIGLHREILFYCPKCLLNQKFFRLLWKIKGVSACCVHICYLNNGCPSCNRDILYRDITNIGDCPYCGFDLSKAATRKVEDEQLINYEQWNERCWTQLITSKVIDSKQADQLSKSVLYILNKQKDELDSKLIQSKIGESTYRQLMQSARGTTKKRTIHLKYLCSLLFDHNIEMVDFLNLNISDVFAKCFNIEKPSRTTKCAAPWCELYNVKGALVPTSSKHCVKNGEKLNNYLFCKACGVEYAFDKNNQLVERTYFIRAYHILTNHNLRNLTWSDRERIMKIKRNRILRVYAYFRSRGLFTDHDILDGIEVEQGKLQGLVDAINDGVDINSLRFSELWKCPNEFLVYRFHRDVIITLQRFPKNKSQQVVDYDFANKVEEACLELIKKDEVITIPKIAKRVGCSSGTIHNKGCRSIIARLKNLQHLDILNESEQFSMKTV